MKKLALALCATLSLSVSAYAETCKVTDPTDTPLNVRSAPNGKIIGKVKNGTVVHVGEYGYDGQGRPWVVVFDVKTDKYIGWVYREFISCY